MFVFRRNSRFDWFATTFAVLLLICLIPNARAAREPVFGYLEQSLNKYLRLDTSQERVVVLNTLSGLLWNNTNDFAVPWGPGLTIRWNHHDLGSIPMFQYYSQAIFAVQPAKPYAQCQLWALQKLKTIPAPINEYLYVPSPSLKQWWQTYKQGGYNNNTSSIRVPFAGQSRRTQNKYDGVFTAESLSIVNITHRKDWLDFGALYSFHENNAAITWGGKNSTVDQVLFADEGVLNAYISAVIIVTNSNTTYQETTPSGFVSTVTSATPFSNQPLSVAAIIKPLPVQATCTPPV